MKTKLLSIELRNFLSYGNNITKINLDFGKAVLVIGRNLDSTVDGQIDSNGSGKTTLLQAIAYACYDQTISGIKVADLINNINGKNMKVAVELLKDGKYYRIERFRKLEKHGTGLYLLCKDSAETPWNYAAKSEGGHDITNDSTGNANAAIEKIIGLPFEIFSRIVIISATYEPFLDLGLDKQRMIVEELFGFTELSEKASKLKDVTKATNNELATLKRLDEQIEAEIQRHTTQLNAVQKQIDDWNRWQQERVAKYDADIEAHKAIDYQAEKQKFEQLDAILTEHRDWTVQLSSQKDDVETLSKTIQAARTWEASHQKELAILRAQIQQANLTVSAEDINTQIENLDSVLALTRPRLQELLSEKQNCNARFAIIAKDMKSAQRDAERITASRDKLQSEVSHLKEAKCPYCLQTFAEADQKIDSLLEALHEHTSELRTVNKTIQTLTDNSAREDNEMREINEAIKLFNEKIAKLEKDKLTQKQLYQRALAVGKLEQEYASKYQAVNPYLQDTSWDELELYHKELSGMCDAIQFEIEKLDNARTALIQTMRFASLAQLVTQEATGQSLMDTRARLVAEKNPHEETLQNLQSFTIGERKTAKIQELHDVVEHQEFLLKLLTKKDSFIRKALLNRYIPFLNSRIKYYLDKIGLQHRVEFTQEMTVKITQFKSEIKFTNMSSGQKARINLALAFSFRDVLQSRYGAINFCVLDEVLDVGLGSTGVQLAAKMIKQVVKDHDLSALIISHRDEVSSMFEAKMTVELKNGFSSIVQSDI